MDLITFYDTPPWDWPQNAGEIFKRILKNPKAGSDRMMAAELAGDLVVMDDEMAELLLSIVQDKAEVVPLRARAAIALGPTLEQTDNEAPSISEATFDEINETLRRIYLDSHEPQEVRRKVLEASVRARREWHTEAIRAISSSNDEHWKLTAAFCMRYIKGFDNEIVEMLNSPNSDIVYQAIHAAANWEVAAAWPQISALLTAKNTEKTLLLAAMPAAAFVRPSEAIPLLKKLLDSDDEEIIEAAHEALMEATASRK